MDKIHTVNFKLGDAEVTLETGRFAPQARGAVLARMGETVVLAAVTASGQRSDKGFFPLSVEYIERLYAGGRISSSRFVKREGRPSEQSVLNARLIDRSVRPLFPKGFANDVQVAVTVLAVDGVNDPAILGLVATSAALHISDIPWEGPIGAVRIGLFEEHGLKINLSSEEQNSSKMDLVVSGTAEHIVMVESAAKEVSEEVILEAFDKALGTLAGVCEGIETLRNQAGKEKFDFTKPTFDEGYKKEVMTFVTPKIDEVLDLIAAKKLNKEDAVSDIKKAAIANFEDREEIASEMIGEVVEELFKKTVRNLTLNKKTRVDGRSLEEIREINVEVSVLPRVHGSGLFMRGMTHTLTTVTLGSPALQQLMESAEGEETKRYMHHYNFPPYSVGEVGRFGSPGRREIGHGNLAERALLAVVPSDDVFPYAIRVVNEIMSSNGSSSMASVCGSTIALMDAGVPIIRPVSGVAMGLMVGSSISEYAVLTDIAGLEDATGDMDFKVAGTTEGVTALQMDIKIKGVSKQIMADALAAAKRARIKILGEMLKVISTPRLELSPYAPRVIRMMILPDMIGLVIGAGGRTINQIIKDCGVTIDIEDDGEVLISGQTSEGVEKAKQMIEALVHEVKVGDIYEGVVKRVVPFGAFVEVTPGKEGLVHISRLSEQRVNRVEDVLNLGDVVQVRVFEIDQEGRINLTLDVDNTWVERPRDEGENGRHERRGDRGGRNNRRW